MIVWCLVVHCFSLNCFNHCQQLQCASLKKVNLLTSLRLIEENRMCFLTLAKYQLGFEMTVNEWICLICLLLVEYFLWPSPKTVSNSLFEPPIFHKYLHALTSEIFFAFLIQNWCSGLICPEYCKCVALFIFLSQAWSFARSKEENAMLFMFPPLYTVSLLCCWWWIQNSSMEALACSRRNGKSTGEATPKAQHPVYENNPTYAVSPTVNVVHGWWFVNPSEQ